MKRTWFIQFGWVYRPVSWQGVALVLCFLAFCIQVFVAVDRHAHSASDTLFGIFPFVVPAAILLYWVASKTSSNAT
ncbi:MAG: hypothetical protein NT159_25230 [Proteobacteria bacterium]|nr:hypothetical protein [Pseudomonadota bacterium]